MTGIEKIPSQWLHPVEKLQAAGYKAVLAGGALRDLYCGRKPKDVDIFVLHDNPHADPWKISKIVDEITPWSKRQYNQITASYCIDYVQRQVPQDGQQWPIIELIGVSNVRNGRDLINRFDFGLCQIGVEDGQVIYTDKFRTDFMCGTFTLLNAYTYERSLERYGKWQEKYHGWPLKKSGVVVLHEYYKSYESNGRKAPEHPLELP